jgi:hypothetical protein
MCTIRKNAENTHSHRSTADAFVTHRLDCSDRRLVVIGAVPLVVGAVRVENQLQLLNDELVERLK